MGKPHTAMKIEKNIRGRMLSFYGEPQSGNIFLQPVAEQDTGRVESESGKLGALCGHTDWCIVSIPVLKWSEELTPWESPPLFGKEGFGSGAAGTLAYIRESVMPYVNEAFPTGGRRYFLCGYSLAGLFALWSAHQTGVFAGIAAVSPSVWYPGWREYARSHPVKVPRVYLSLGLKEEKAKNRVMATVGDAIREQYELLSGRGVTCTLEWNEGNHFVDSDGRMAKGLAWLLNDKLEFL